jgi:hypothetical protein
MVQIPGSTPQGTPRDNKPRQSNPYQPFSFDDFPGPQPQPRDRRSPPLVGVPALIVSQEMIRDPQESPSLDEEVIAAICQDVRDHIARLEPGFYGYALVPWDMCTQLPPPTLSAVVNREEDIDPKNREDDYYRFGVDEWALWEHEGFDRSGRELANLYNGFNAGHQKDPDDFEFDDEEIAFLTRFYSVHLEALLRLRNEGAFGADTFVVIWVSDSDANIMIKSAKLLNSPTTYRRFATQFGDQQEG